MLLNGPAGYLQEPMDHYAYNGISSFVEKHNRYSTWESQVGRRYLDPETEEGHMALSLRLRRAVRGHRAERHQSVFGVGRLADGDRDFHYTQDVASRVDCRWLRLRRLRR